MAVLNQSVYDELTPKQRKSLKSSSGWLIDAEVNTAVGQRASQKVTLIGESEEFSSTLLGPVPAGVGIELTTGSLTTGDKSDTIIGSGNLTGIALGEGTSISTNGGNDTLNGTGGENTGYGIFLSGALINTGSDTGPDNDTINGSGGQAGIAVLFGSAIYTDSDDGSGNDSITGTSLGVPNPLDPGNFSGGIGIQLGGLLNSGFIYTGDGNDSVAGDGVNAGISVSVGSELSTGAGEDTVNAEKGGFAGAGLIDLGEDNDTLIGGGFGSTIVFKGGMGVDTILLSDGTYVYDDNGDGTGVLTAAGDPSPGSMNLDSFELIGGIGGTTIGLVADTFMITDGIVTVV